jgi:hypothetical protein
MADIQPRRSARQPRPIQRLQPEGRRQQRRPIPYERQARNRRLQQEQQQNHRQEQRHEVVQAARNDVPTTFQDIQKKIRHDDRDQIIPEAIAITNKLPATIREIAGGQMTKISVSLGDDGTQFHHAHSKYNLGDFNIRPNFDAYSLLRSEK